MGDVWQCQIQTVQKMLSFFLQNNAEQLDDESIGMSCEAEAIVNSRLSLSISSLIQIYQNQRPQVTY